MSNEGGKCETNLMLAEGIIANAVEPISILRPKVR
jgi:hypothetical protein